MGVGLGLGSHEFVIDGVLGRSAETLAGELGVAEHELESVGLRRDYILR